MCSTLTPWSWSWLLNPFPHHFSLPSQIHLIPGFEEPVSRKKEKKEKIEGNGVRGKLWGEEFMWCDLNSKPKVKERSLKEIKPSTVGFDQPWLGKPDREKWCCNVYQKKSSLKGLWELRKLKINKVRTSSDEGQQTSTSGLSAAVQLDGIQRSLRCGEATGFGKAFPVKWQINGGEVDLHTARVTKSRTKPGELRQDYIWLWQSS